MSKNQQNLALPKNTIIPRHISIVLDGNRRWARSHGLPIARGHKAGFEAMRKVVRASRTMGVHTLTVWGFSTENWDRSTFEIKKIMSIVRLMLRDIEKEAQEDGVRIIHLGRKDRLPKDIISQFEKLEHKTKNNKNHVLNVALDYGGRDEILRAVRKILGNGITKDKIDEKLFDSYLDTRDQPYPDPDLFIRPSGEQRTSGLLPWQIVYAEYYWEPSTLPDFTPEKLRDAILDYSRRRRRFGGNDEIKHFAFDAKKLAALEVKSWQASDENTFAAIRAKQIQEKFGLSREKAQEAAKLLTLAKSKQINEAEEALFDYYLLLKKELGLAFDPKRLVELELKIREENGLTDETTTEYLAEFFRISIFQASKAASFMTLANREKDKDLKKAQDYLIKHYKALKEKVA